MANPNIVNVSNILGKTAGLVVTTSATAIVSNSSASNKIFKINSLVISNVDDDNHEITVDIFRSSTATRIATNIVVPASASLVIISKDTSIYLEEGDSLRLTGSGEEFTNNDLEAVCSYEEIS